MIKTYCIKKKNSVFFPPKENPNDQNSLNEKNSIAIFGVLTIF